LEQQINELKEIIIEQKEMIDIQNQTIELICDEYSKRIIEIHAEHNATEEKLKQITKKDEMKTALLKQFMQKK
jgi:hypothetical protein